MNDFFYRQIETIKTKWHDAFGMMQISEFYRRVRGERRGIKNPKLGLERS